MHGGLSLVHGWRDHVCLSLLTVQAVGPGLAFLGHFRVLAIELDDMLCSHMQHIRADAWRLRMDEESPIVRTVMPLGFEHRKANSKPVPP